MKNIAVLIILVLLTNFINVQAGWDDIILTTQKYINCPLNVTYPNPFRNLVMRKNGVTDGLFINGELVVTDTVSHGAMIHMEAIKCMIPNDDNSCSPYHTFVVEFCSTVFNKQNVWMSWVDSIKNFDKCPIEPGVYPIEDMPMDFNRFGPWRILANPERYIGHWKMDIKFINGQVLETCLELEGDVKKRRRKSNKIDLPL